MCCAACFFFPATSSLVAGFGSSSITNLVRLLLAGTCHPEKNTEFAKMFRECGQLLLLEQPCPPTHWDAVWPLWVICGFVILWESP